VIKTGLTKLGTHAAASKPEAKKEAK